MTDVRHPPVISVKVAGRMRRLATAKHWRSAISNGELSRDTPVIIERANGQPAQLAAGDIEELLNLFDELVGPVATPPPPPPPARVSAPPPPNPPLSVVRTFGTDAAEREAVPRQRIQGAVIHDNPHATISVVATNSKKSSKRKVRELTPNQTRDDSKGEIVIDHSVSSDPHNEAGHPVAKIVGVVLGAMLALMVLINVFDSNEAAMSDGSIVTAAADTEALESSTDAAAGTSSDSTAAASSDSTEDAEMASITPTMPYDPNAPDSCSELLGFEKVICQSPELKSKDRQVRTAWYWAQRRMAQASEDVEPLSQILGRIELCSSKSCALSAYAAEISMLENTSPQNAASDQRAEVSQFAEAKPRGNPGNWVNVNDYPARALQQEREGTTAFRVTIGTDGRVIDCSITKSSGHDDLDTATCTNVMRRARFEPAVGNGGNVQGTYSNRVRWQVPR